ncbi:MAG: ATP-binding protein [Bacteroidales bacterium]|jgi:nitrogen fixation/metabolism regulation signal transduction histidine kinase|nr:ATP-binding protein [Bacteroidales bacterium]
MVFNRFRIAIAWRVILLALTLFLFFLLLEIPRYQFSAFIIGLFLILEVIFLIRYVERTNRKLTRFFESIRYADFSSSFSDPGLGKSFEDLSREFNQVIEAFRKYRTEKEEHYHYLQTVIQHVPIGIMVFKRDGKIEVFNQAMTRILKIRNIRFISELKRIKEDLPLALMGLKAGNSTLFKVFTGDEFLQIFITATEFRMHGEDYTLVSMQNISAELDEKEIESWQKMIRVLTHEIMNSITPITSLASTVHEMTVIQEEGKKRLNNLDAEDIESVDSALKTIQNRSQGLLNFVEVYRDLTRIPKPNFRYFRISELFERCSLLLKPKMEAIGIECSSKVFPPDLMITADPDLIDQVVINLMLNAIDAVREVEKPRITILATINSANRIIIDFQDNGTGIMPDIMDKIFMPFFTSKKHGNGIGLSLSRQIMHLHKGSILVRSKPEEGTVFTLVF